MSDLERELGNNMLKIQHPAVIHDPHPDKRDYLDCTVVKTMELDELQKLKAMLSAGSTSWLRVDFQIKTIIYPPMAKVNIRSSIMILDNSFNNKIPITNVGLDRPEGRNKINNLH